MLNSSASPNPLTEDLDLVLSQTGALWDSLRGGRLFLTGGTGFFGTWLLESFCWANRILNLNATAVVLSRNPSAFFAKAPHLKSDPSLSFHLGDVRDFSFPNGSFSHMIHGATTSSAALNKEDPLLMLETIVAGTKRTLDFAVRAGVQSYLLISSGAVYGTQPSEITHMPETYMGGPDVTNPDSAYGEGKRTAELLCAIYGTKHALQIKIARCFAFVGPHLPLDAHFAIGNFIRDRLRGGPIVVNGDGTPYRSYLYAADLVIWLWTILLRGEVGRAYNVGSDEDFHISDIARAVAQCGEEEQPVQIEGVKTSGPAQRYVPSTQRALKELSLKKSVPLSIGIKRTASWYAK